MEEFVLISLVIFLFLGYYSRFQKLGKSISIYMLFPPQEDINRRKIILYSRVYIHEEGNTILKDKDINVMLCEHTERSYKLKLYTNWRISEFVRLRLKLWLAHVRYKPGSLEHKKLLLNYK